MSIIFLIILLFTGCYNKDIGSKVIPTNTPKSTNSPIPTNEILGSYTTNILNKDGNRVNNIKIASNRINDVIIKPNEEFSFNGYLGKRTESKGYELAPIIDGYGVGGGICQVSSTLYNAALGAKLEIVEIHHHSEMVKYVPFGKDATVVYGDKDLRFVNNKGYSIIIKSNVTNDNITIDIKKTL